MYRTWKRSGSGFINGDFDITLAEYSFSPTMEELEEMMFEVAKEILILQERL